MKKVKSLISIVLAMLMVAGCFVGASAAAVSETESNNIVADATEFNVGDTASGKINENGDVDCFKFKATKSGFATVSLSHTVNNAPSTYFAVEVKDAASKTLASFESTGKDAKVSEDVSVEKDATYYVIVKQGTVCDPTVAYTLSVAVKEFDYAESEPNNKATEADVLEYSPKGASKLYNGAISEGDSDYYKVTFPADGIINVYLYNSTNAGNYKATLYAYVEDGGSMVLRPVTAIEVDENSDKTIGASVGVAKGDYYLLVEGVDGCTGSYGTRILFKGAAAEGVNIETEMNDALATADVISLGKSYLATLDENGDVDCFKFTAPANNKGYDFKFTSESTGSWTIEIVNSDNGKVVEPVVLNANIIKTATAETSPLAAGTYYIRVSLTDGTILDKSYYTLSVSEKAEAVGGDDEEEKNLFDRIGDLNWGGLWENFAGWIEQINFMGMLSSIFGSIIKVFTYLGSMA